MRRIVGALLLVLSGCGPGVVVIAAAITVPVEDESSPSRSTRLEKATFIDVDRGSQVGPADILVVRFSGQVSLSGTPGADSIFDLDPPGTCGLSARVVPGMDTHEIHITIIPCGASSACRRPRPPPGSPSRCDPAC